MCIATEHFGLNVKDSDLTGFFFGLIFEMKGDVGMLSVEILPHCNALKYVLPSEAFVTKFKTNRANYSHRQNEEL